MHQTKYLIEIGVSADASRVGARAGQPASASRARSSSAMCRTASGANGPGRSAASASSICYAALIALQAGTDARCCSTPWCWRRASSAMRSTAVLGPIVAEIYEGPHFGAIFGTLMLAAITGGAVGPWVTGLIYDRTGNYDLGFWIALAALRRSRRSRSSSRRRARCGLSRASCPGAIDALTRHFSIELLARRAGTTLNSSPGAGRFFTDTACFGRRHSRAPCPQAFLGAVQQAAGFRWSGYYTHALRDGASFEQVFDQCTASPEFRTRQRSRLIDEQVPTFEDFSAAAPRFRLQIVFVTTDGVATVADAAANLLSGLDERLSS